MPGRVLFVIPDLFQDDIHLPLGPAYLSAVLRQAGAEVEIYDMQVHHYTNEQLAEHLDNNEYQMICIGFLAARYSTAHEILKVIGDHKKSSSLIVGGHGPSPIPSFILQDNPAVDVVCIGEAEETILDLYYNMGLNSILGIVYRHIGYIKTNPGRKPVQNLDSIPFPAWDLFDMEIYSEVLHLWGQEKGDRCIGFLSSRGCVGQCSFCHRLEGHGVRFRSAKNIVDEMEFLCTEYNINGYFLYDEMFVASEDRLRRIKQELEDRCL
ncbi:MAG: cobalamin-dependent protein, partial [Gammaproteobacteria bacterium]|nr:cobalamin-dependent protein [Gammaproteobacteria bacterium]